MSTTHEPEPETANATGNATTVDIDAFLEQNLGRRYRNMAESVALVTVYSVIFLTGIAGNVCTCIVIVRNKRMHTATNYYLFSLAVSDLLTLVLGQSLTRPLYLLDFHLRTGLAGPFRYIPLRSKATSCYDSKLFMHLTRAVCDHFSDSAGQLLYCYFQ